MNSVSGINQLNPFKWGKNWAPVVHGAIVSGVASAVQEWGYSKKWDMRISAGFTHFASLAASTLADAALSKLVGTWGITDLARTPFGNVGSTQVFVPPKSIPVTDTFTTFHNKPTYVLGPLSLQRWLPVIGEGISLYIQHLAEKHWGLDKYPELGRPLSIASSSFFNELSTGRLPLFKTITYSAIHGLVSAGYQWLSTEIKSPYLGSFLSFGLSQMFSPHISKIKQNIQAVFGNLFSGGIATLDSKGNFLYHTPIGAHYYTYWSDISRRARSLPHSGWSYQDWKYYQRTHKLPSVESFAVTPLHMYFSNLHAIATRTTTDAIYSKITPIAQYLDEALVKIRIAPGFLGKERITGKIGLEKDVLRWLEKYGTSRIRKIIRKIIEGKPVKEIKELKKLISEYSKECKTPFKELNEVSNPSHYVEIKLGPNQYLQNYEYSRGILGVFLQLFGWNPPYPSNKTVRQEICQTIPFASDEKLVIAQILPSQWKLSSITPAEAKVWGWQVFDYTGKFSLWNNPSIIDLSSFKGKLLPKPDLVGFYPVKDLKGYWESGVWVWNNINKKWEKIANPLTGGVFINPNSTFPWVTFEFKQGFHSVYKNLTTSKISLPNHSGINLASIGGVWHSKNGDKVVCFNKGSILSFIVGGTNPLIPGELLGDLFKNSNQVERAFVWTMTFGQGSGAISFGQMFHNKLKYGERKVIGGVEVEKGIERIGKGIIIRDFSDRRRIISISYDYKYNKYKKILLKNPSLNDDYPIIIIRISSFPKINKIDLEKYQPIFTENITDYLWGDTPFKKFNFNEFNQKIITQSEFNGIFNKSIPLGGTPISPRSKHQYYRVFVAKEGWEFEPNNPIFYSVAHKNDDTWRGNFALNPSGLNFQYDKEGKLKSFTSTIYRYSEVIQGDIKKQINYFKVQGGKIKKSAIFYIGNNDVVTKGDGIYAVLITRGPTLGTAALEASTNRKFTYNGKKLQEGLKIFPDLSSQFNGWAIGVDKYPVAVNNTIFRDPPDFKKRPHQLSKTYLPITEIPAKVFQTTVGGNREMSSEQFILAVFRKPNGEQFKSVEELKEYYRQKVGEDLKDFEDLEKHKNIFKIADYDKSIKIKTTLPDSTYRMFILSNEPVCTADMKVEFGEKGTLLNNGIWVAPNQEFKDWKKYNYVIYTPDGRITYPAPPSLKEQFLTQKVYQQKIQQVINELSRPGISQTQRQELQKNLESLFSSLAKLQQNLHKFLPIKISIVPTNISTEEWFSNTKITKVGNGLIWTDDSAYLTPGGDIRVFLSSEKQNRLRKIVEKFDDLIKKEHKLITQIHRLEAQGQKIRKTITLEMIKNDLFFVGTGTLWSMTNLNPNDIRKATLIGAFPRLSSTGDIHIAALFSGKYFLLNSIINTDPRKIKEAQQEVTPWGTIKQSSPGPKNPKQRETTQSITSSPYYSSTSLKINGFTPPSVMEAEGVLEMINVNQMWQDNFAQGTRFDFNTPTYLHIFTGIDGGINGRETVIVYNLYADKDTTLFMGKYGIVTIGRGLYSDIKFNPQNPSALPISIYTRDKNGRLSIAGCFYPTPNTHFNINSAELGNPNSLAKGRMYFIADASFKDSQGRAITALGDKNRIFAGSVELGVTEIQKGVYVIQGKNGVIGWDGVSLLFGDIPPGRNTKVNVQELKKLRIPITHNGKYYLIANIPVDEYSYDHKGCIKLFKPEGESPDKLDIKLLTQALLRTRQKSGDKITYLGVEIPPDVWENITQNKWISSAPFLPEDYPNKLKEIYNLNLGKENYFDLDYNLLASPIDVNIGTLIVIKKDTPFHIKFFNPTGKFIRPMKVAISKSGKILAFVLSLTKNNVPTIKDLSLYDINTKKFVRVGVKDIIFENSLPFYTLSREQKILLIGNTILFSINGNNRKALIKALVSFLGNSGKFNENQLRKLTQTIKKLLSIKDKNLLATKIGKIFLKTFGEDVGKDLIIKIKIKDKIAQIAGEIIGEKRSIWQYFYHQAQNKNQQGILFAPKKENSSLYNLYFTPHTPIPFFSVFAFEPLTYNKKLKNKPEGKREGIIEVFPIGSKQGVDPKQVEIKVNDKTEAKWFAQYRSNKIIPLLGYPSHIINAKKYLIHDGAYFDLRKWAGKIANGYAGTIEYKNINGKEVAIVNGAYTPLFSNEIRVIKELGTNNIVVVGKKPGAYFIEKTTVKDGKITEHNIYPAKIKNRKAIINPNATASEYLNVGNLVRPDLSVQYFNPSLSKWSKGRWSLAFNNVGRISQ